MANPHYLELSIILPCITAIQSESPDIVDRTTPWFVSKSVVYRDYKESNCRLKARLDRDITIKWCFMVISWSSRDFEGIDLSTKYGTVFTRIVLHK